MSDRGAPAGHVAMASSVGIYAIGIVLQKQLALTVPFALIAFWQFSVSATVLWALSLSISRNLELKTVHLLAGLAWGMIAPGASLMINMVGSRTTDGVTMMMIWGLLPLVAPLIGPLLIGERFRPIIVFSGVLAIGGVWIGVGDRVALGWSTASGPPLVAIAVLMAGCGLVLGRWLNRGDVSWHRFAALQVTGAALVALPVCAFGPGLSPEPLANTGALGTLAYLVVGMTVLNFLVFNFALARIPATWASIYTALNAPFGAIAALLILGDALRLRDVVMILVVTISVALPHYIEWRAKAMQRR